MVEARPIVIVGAGPVGLCLALALVARGLTVELYEAEAQLAGDLRGGAYHPPTLDRFDGWGILGAMRHAGLEVRELCYWERSRRECVARFDYRLIEGDARFPFRLHCMQHVLARIALDRLQASPRFRARFGHRLTDLEVDDAGARARFASETGTHDVDAAIVCGADGAHSTVRARLGLTFDGVSHEDRFLVLNGHFGVDDELPGLAPVNYIFDPEEWVIVLKMPGFTRIAFRARDDEDEATLLSPAGAAARLERLFGHPTACTLLHRAIYRVHERVASSFHRGRAAILGDAAHINNPAGGMGLNAGIADAAALAEVIAAIMDGAPHSHLEEYTARRRAQVAATVLARAGENLAQLRASEAVARIRRNEGLRAIAADPRRAREHLLRFSMIDDPTITA